MDTSHVADGHRRIGAEHYRAVGEAAQLNISTCRGCGGSWFPARTQCSTCASRDVETVLTSDTGIAYASTVVRVGPKPFAAPYVLAYIDIDGVRVLTHAVSSTDALAPGTPVRLIEAAIAADDQGPLLSYAVTAQAARQQ